MELQGKVVLITGASSGIGAAAAELFADAGADVALLARSEEGLAVVAERVRSRGVRALVLPADVTDRLAVATAVAQTVSELGSLDVLVSNAAAVVFGRFEQVEPDAFDRTIDITFTGAVNVIRSALPELARRNGTMVVVGSIMTKMPLPTFSSYAAAKHALRGFLASLRMELHAAGDPVTVSLVNPGPVDTPLWEHTHSATGLQPRRPPDAYTPESMAKVIVACAKEPRSEVTVGGEARLMEMAYLYTRPLGEQLLGIAHRLYTGGKHPSLEGGSIWGPVGRGRKRDDMHGRPSLWAPIRLALDAPRRALRRR